MKLFLKVTGGFRDKVVNSYVENKASKLRKVAQLGDTACEFLEAL